MKDILQFPTHCGTLRNIVEQDRSVYVSKLIRQWSLLVFGIGDSDCAAQLLMFQLVCFVNRCRMWCRNRQTRCWSRKRVRCTVWFILRSRLFIFTIALGASFWYQQCLCASWLHVCLYVMGRCDYQTDIVFITRNLSEVDELCFIQWIVWTNVLALA